MKKKQKDVDSQNLLSKSSKKIFIAFERLLSQTRSPQPTSILFFRSPSPVAGFSHRHRERDPLLLFYHRFLIDQDFACRLRVDLISLGFVRGQSDLKAWGLWLEVLFGGEFPWLSLLPSQLHEHCGLVRVFRESRCSFSRFVIGFLGASLLSSRSSVAVVLQGLGVLGRGDVSREAFEDEPCWMFFASTSPHCCLCSVCLRWLLSPPVG